MRICDELRVPAVLGCCCVFWGAARVRLRSPPYRAPVHSGPAAGAQRGATRVIGRIPPIMDGVSEKLPRLWAPHKAMRAQASNHIEVSQAGGIADERPAVERKWHQACPVPCCGHVPKSRHELLCMLFVFLPACGKFLPRKTMHRIGYHSGMHSSIATEDETPFPCLLPVQMTCVLLFPAAAFGPSPVRHPYVSRHP